MVTPKRYKNAFPTRDVGPVDTGYTTRGELEQSQPKIIDFNSLSNDIKNNYTQYQTKQSNITGNFEQDFDEPDVALDPLSFIQKDKANNKEYFLDSNNNKVFTENTMLDEQFSQDLKRSKKDIFGNRYILDDSGNKVLLKDKYPGKQQIISDDKSLFKQKFNNAKDTVSDNFGLSRTGLSTPIGELQYGDVANLMLAWNAYKKPVSKQKVFQEKFVDTGSRSVRAARDLPPEIINANENIISKIKSGYNGSDVNMSLIGSNIRENQKADARMNLASKMAQYRRGEEDRVDSEMNQKRQEQAANIQRGNQVVNNNRARIIEGDNKAAAAEQQRRTEWLGNLGQFFTNFQNRANKYSAEVKNSMLADDARTRDMERANLLERIKNLNIIENTAQTEDRRNAARDQRIALENRYKDFKNERTVKYYDEKNRSLPFIRDKRINSSGY
jgi:hypothetical protein